MFPLATTCKTELSKASKPPTNLSLHCLAVRPLIFGATCCHGMGDKPYPRTTAFRILSSCQIVMCQTVEKICRMNRKCNIDFYRLRHDPPLIIINTAYFIAIHDHNPTQSNSPPPPADCFDVNLGCGITWFNLSGPASSALLVHATYLVSPFFSLFHAYLRYRTFPGVLTFHLGSLRICHSA